MTSRRSSVAEGGAGVTPLRFPSATAALQQSPTSRTGSKLSVGAPEVSAGSVPDVTAVGGTSSSPGVVFPQKASLAALCDIFRQFSALYGPVVVLLENLHDFDTWSWQLLVKLCEELSGSCLVIATTRPNNAASVTAPPGGGPSSEPVQAQPHLHLQSKAAMYARVATLYRQLLSLNSSINIKLGPFTFDQTRELMKV